MAKRKDDDAEEEVTGVITALFKPTAEYLGSELCEIVKETVESLKSRRRDRNLKHHIAIARVRIATERSNSSPSSAAERLEADQPLSKDPELLAQWLEGVQDVDPASEELTELWQSLLAAAANGKHVSTDVLNALRTLSPAEAVILLEFLQSGPSELHLDVPFRLIGFGHVHSSKRYLLRSLAARHLIERDYSKLPTMLTFFGISGVFLILGLTSFQQSIWIGLSTTVLSMTTAGLTALYSQYCVGHWQLSWLGVEVTKHAKPTSTREYAMGTRKGVHVDTKS